MDKGIAIIKTHCLNDYHKCFDICRLAGPAFKDVRQKIYSDLTGVKQPKSKSGITAIETWIFDKFKPQGDCSANKDRDLFRILTDYKTQFGS